MKVLSISFDDDGKPDTATVVLTRKEMQLIAKFVGEQSPAMREKFLPGHSEAGEGLYDALTGMVFNPYWEDALNEAIRGAGD